MRYFCIDLGDKRTGLAVGDDATGICLPLDVLEIAIDADAGQALLRAVLDALADQFSPHAKAEIVVGLPLNMDSTRGPRAKIATAFADRLRPLLNPPRTIHLFDERLSTAQADARMARTGLTRGQKKARRDAIAAAAILENFLRSRAVPPAPTTAPDQP
jgi:putative Holliday junction resolvase